MKYKKINEATVQCIVSADDMAEYGLALSDIFERSERGEEFLRVIIERAHEEVGYQISGGNIAMQITPLKNDGLVVTFTDERPADFRGMLQHIKEALQSLSEELSDQEEAARLFDDNRRMFVFASLHQAMQYAAAIPNTYSVKSHLFKEGEDYYLVLEKGRLSYKTFNKISAQAVEFGNLIAVSEERLQYLEEHAECLIRDRAVSRLRRIYRA
ncbi:MAG: adaptor protein MecA [Bacteroidales bacterium]|nr:adaptor protein MecA [Bacteroidales bacterium]MCM1415348.1 adaptor protein MecA [bacterium]MCM1424011.1 adaptor protein MecA [bacterium]